jgi:hypothetical protein
MVEDLDLGRCEEGMETIVTKLPNGDESIVFQVGKKVRFLGGKRKG